MSDSSEGEVPKPLEVPRSEPEEPSWYLKSLQDAFPGEPDIVSFFAGVRSGFTLQPSADQPHLLASYAVITADSDELAALWQAYRASQPPWLMVVATMLRRMHYLNRHKLPIAEDDLKPLLEVGRVIMATQAAGSRMRDLEWVFLLDFWSLPWKNSSPSVMRQRLVFLLELAAVLYRTTLPWDCLMFTMLNLIYEFENGKIQLVVPPAILAAYAKCEEEALASLEADLREDQRRGTEISADFLKEFLEEYRMYPRICALALNPG